MRIVTLAALVLVTVACGGSKPQPSIPGDSGAGADTTDAPHTVTAKTEPDTVFDERGNICIVTARPKFMQVQVGDVHPAGTFCRWRPLTRE